MTPPPPILLAYVPNKTSYKKTYVISKTQNNYVSFLKEWINICKSTSYA